MPQEYVCVDLYDFQDPLSVLLELKNTEQLIDVTQGHLFLGYKPVIIGLVAGKNSELHEQLLKEEIVRLNFDHGHDAKNNNGKKIATLVLKKICEKEFEDQVVFFLEAVEGHHIFLNKLYQFAGRLRQAIRHTKPDNVSLVGNLYEQVRIAYSVPRKISVVSVSDGRLMNLFPTDLHGPVGEKFYISSLRINGLANSQVDNLKKIVISEVEAGGYRQIYALGKNHMRELRDRNEFELNAETSAAFGYPLPVWSTRYRELKQISSFDYGLHRIHVYEVIHEHQVNTKTSTLAHIHQYYAQWRVNEKLATHFLVR